MSKFLKYTTLTVLLVAVVFLLTGCSKEEKKEQKENTKSLFEVEQVNDKTIKVNLENAKQGEEKEAKLVIADGEDIYTTTKMEGASGVTVYYFKEGSEHNKDASDSEYLNGEGESSTEDFPAGTYDVLIEATDAPVTGTIEINIK